MEIEDGPQIFAPVATVAATLVFGLQPAAAYEAPCCAVISMGAGDVHWDCQYRSIEECRPNVLAGNRGFCNPNPYVSRHLQNRNAPGSVALARSSSVTGYVIMSASGTYGT